MALYYFTADYSGEAFSGMVNSPQDRESAARKLIEAVGRNFTISISVLTRVKLLE